MTVTGCSRPRDDTPAAPSASSPPPPAPPLGAARVLPLSAGSAAESPPLSVYSGPGTRFAELTKLPTQAMVKVVETSFESDGYWVRIEHPEAGGWVSAGRLEPRPASELVPPVPPVDFPSGPLASPSASTGQGKPGTAEGRHSAIAVGPSGRWGWSNDQDSQGDAIQRALMECGPTCKILVTFVDECAALAFTKDKTQFGWSKAASKADANNRALKECSSVGQGCTVDLAVCSR